MNDPFHHEFTHPDLDGDGDRTSFEEADTQIDIRAWVELPHAVDGGSDDVRVRVNPRAR